MSTESVWPPIGERLATVAPTGDTRVAVAVLVLGTVAALWSVWSAHRRR